MHLYIHSSTIYNSEDMETTQLSIHRWMDYEDVTLSLYIYMHTHLDILWDTTQSWKMK